MMLLRIVKYSENHDVDTILISDVHLGADLVQHARPWTAERLTRPPRVDAPLVALLDSIRKEKTSKAHLRLVLAGDIFEFVGMSILPKDVPAQRLSEDEKQLGLGRTEAHSVIKLKAIAERHRSVFSALGRFIGDGHSIIVLPGNHDADLFWPEVERALIEAVTSLAPVATVPRGEIFFSPWFYFDRGLYVEHGHIYDPMTTRSWFLAPNANTTPDVVRDALSDIFIRRLIIPTPGLGTHGLDGASFRKAFDFMASLGPKQSALFFMRAQKAFVRAFRELGPCEVMQVAHARALRNLKMEAPFADALVVDALADIVAPSGLSSMSAMFNAFRPPLGLSDTLQQAATNIERIVQPRMIVMGHTHEPLLAPLERGAHYINLGNWGVDEPDNPYDAPPEEAPCTYLHVKHRGDRVTWEFSKWRQDKGPERIATFSS